MSHVNGVLKEKKHLCPSFQQYYNKCKQPMSPNSPECIIYKHKQPMSPNSLDCIICKKNTTYTYEHSLEFTLNIKYGKIECIMCMPQLQEYFPLIKHTNFEDYRKSISSTAFHLHKFFLKGMFTLIVDNVVTKMKPS